MSAASLSWATVYWLFPLCAACICTFVAIRLFDHRKKNGATALMMVLIAVAWWAFAYAMEFLSASLEVKLDWVKLEYFGFAWVGVFLLAFILAVTGKEQWLAAHRMLAVSIIPTVGPILAVTNEFHGLMWRKAWLITVHSTSVIAYDRGIGFWVIAGYAYLLLMSATLILLQFYRNSNEVQRKRIRIILLGIMLPWLSNALYLSGLSPLASLDLTSLAFAVSGILFSLGLFRFQILDIVPIAKETLLEAIGDAVIVLDLQDRIVHENSRATALLGSKHAGQDPTTASGIHSAILSAVRGLRRNHRKETEIRLTAQGPEKIYNLQVSPLYSKTKQQVGWLVHLRDITERKKAELAIRDSEEKFRNVSDNALDGIIMIDPAGKILLWNQAAKGIFGFSEKEALGRELHTLLTPRKYHQKYFRRFSEYVRTGLGPVIGKTVEMNALRKDGTEFPIELSVSSLHLKKRWHAVGIVRDISERKRSEAEKEELQKSLQRARKMEALGTLAGGVAHDLNNILSGIASYPDLLLMQIPEDSPLQKPLEIIRESGNKAAAIVQDLLTLARRSVATREIVYLNTVASEYLDSPEYCELSRSNPKVQVATLLAENLPCIQGSRLHLFKTLMNLVINGFEAMPKGGNLSIRTEEAHLDRPKRGIETIPPGNYVTLIVCDEGIGIPEEDRDRIFEPFYTRKHMGKSGTGLGMAVVWGTVKDFDGYLEIESTQGLGTTFTLYFPKVELDQETVSANQPDQEEYRGKGESVLVVDDVAEQRTIASEMLRHLGYVPETADSGESALEFLSDGHADLVLLDMIMEPGMDGLDTYNEIRKASPGQKVLIASGFSEGKRVRKAQQLGAGSYIKKPYSMKDLAIKVRKELDR